MSTADGMHDDPAPTLLDLASSPAIPPPRRSTPSLLPPSGNRYEDVSPIASGSFGEVRRVYDRLLGRPLAMKLLRLDHVENDRVRARFLVEAEITAGLSHPGIVAVHDRGELPDGRLWYTMQEVRGRTLEAVISEIHAEKTPEGFRQAPSGWTFRRAVDAFVRVAHAVAYAHRQGIVHRDLKPANIMVGDLGEVLVMDWGLACRLGEVKPCPEELPESMLEASIIDSTLTREGEVLGTPAYMPPEQARGQRHLHGPQSDVYALGSILYHLLSGQAPVTIFKTMRQFLANPPPRVVDAARGGPPPPSELVAVCERAMARAIDDRYPDAAAMAEEIVAWLDGARRREQALAALAKAQALLPALTELRAQAAERRAAAEVVLNAVRPFDPLEKKEPGWRLEDEAKALEVEVALREIEWVHAVRGALSLDPDLAEAHAALADHYRDRLREAEIENRDADVARAEAMLRAHDRGRYAAVLRGEGALTVVTDTPGAVVLLERYVEQHRRLVPEPLGELGRTPLRAVTLPHGSYRLRLRAPGRAEVIYPVLIERDGHWDCCPPGEREPHPIALPAEGELGPEDVYIPAGYTWVGGDPQAGDSLPSRRIWIDAFVIRRFPVTNTEYLDFLNDLVAQGREEEALAACPRSQLGMAGAVGEQFALGRDEQGRFTPPPGEAGRVFMPDAPVTEIDWYGAAAYVAWLGTKTGLPWRLPNELEREKATRGVDRRFCPCGNYIDGRFLRAAESFEHSPKIARVDDDPLDESPYGVRGLGGNSRDWCFNVWRRDGPTLRDGRLTLDPASGDEVRAVRGGAWSSPLEFCRAATRFGGRPGTRRLTMGMRLARSYMP